MRGITAIAILLLVGAHAADDLPRRMPDEKMDFEPGLLTGLPAQPEPLPAVPRLEAALVRARKAAADGARLFRAGVIAKVESENRALKVVKFEADLAAARTEAAKAELARLRGKLDPGIVSQREIDQAQISADEASAQWTRASAAWERAELAAAELNLSRQTQLVAAGVGSKTMLRRAQAQVAALKDKLPRPVFSPAE